MAGSPPKSGPMLEALRRRPYVPLVAICLLQLALSLWHLRGAECIADGDTSAYYVVARNFAMGRGLSDTIMWNYIGHTPTVVRPAGDWWGIGWPVLLGLIMQGVGTGQQVIMLVCAGLSALLPAAVYALGRQVGSPAASLLAAFLVVFQGRLFMSDTMPDVTLPYSLALMGALILALKAWKGRSPRLALAAGLAFAGCCFLRTDGFIGLLAPLIAQKWQSRDRLVFALLVGFMVGLVPLGAYNLAAFGHLSPPPRKGIFWMIASVDTYSFDVQPSPQRWAQRPLRDIVGGVTGSVGHMLWRLFCDDPWPLVVLALAGGVKRRTSPDVRTLSWTVLLLWLVPCLVAPYVASPLRLEGHATPILCILAVLGLPELPRLAARARLLQGGLLALALGWHWPLPFQPGWNGAYSTCPAFARDRGALARLGLHPYDVVLTTSPWAVAAQLDVSTLLCPADPEVSAVYHVIDFYRPRFLMIEEGTRLAAFRDATGLRWLPLRELLRTPGSTWYEITYPSRPATTEGGREDPRGASRGHAGQAARLGGLAPPPRKALRALGDWQAGEARPPRPAVVSLESTGRPTPRASPT
jgi:hypothetical protein